MHSGGDITLIVLVLFLKLNFVKELSIDTDFKVNQIGSLCPFEEDAEESLPLVCKCPLHSKSDGFLIAEILVFKHVLKKIQQC